MKIGGSKFFYLGAVLALVGIMLMSLPEPKCVDCEDEVSDDAIYIVTDETPESVESPSDD